jgi:hypothetical protein
LKQVALLLSKQNQFSYAALPVTSACRADRRRLLRLCRASRCLGMSRGSSRGSSCRSLSTTPPRAGSSSTTSPSPHVRVPRHVARLVTRLVVDYFDYVACSGALARRAARHMARHAVRRQLRLRRVSGCLSTSRGSLSTSSPTPCIWVPRHVMRLVTRLVVDYSARRDFVLQPH